ncbi:MAG: nitrate/sulfonate/bicarbonate ABC transporter ATP-binding protein, partial [Verrucomicrobia bacterium]|nr:nitrate/sulfonate/bicarbonate ABC transporter ATP-binding protein [Verrucomicrobiota bacterium]
MNNDGQATLTATLTERAAVAELCNITKTYTVAGGRELKVLDQIDLAVHEGELLALLGQSGSGKSTLLRCLTGLALPTSGRVLAYGKPLEGINPFASIVFQTFALYPWLTVEQNVGVGLMSKVLTRAEKEEAVEKAIDLIGLDNYHDAYPREISGGMRQRVGIARALVAEPKILCLDEAFSALDVLTAENLRNEVTTLWQRQATTLRSIFMVTHNIEEAVEMATRICVLFPHPGRLGLVMENQLAYPRNPNDPEFQRLVKVIHETITLQALPDIPPEPAPVSGRPISRARARMESIPTVSVGRIIGLLSILQDHPDLDNIYDLANEIGADFGEIISLVKAAEILEFVNTPKDDVQFTELGKKFVAADSDTRAKIFAEQVKKLRLFHIILGYLEVQEEIDRDTVMKDIATALPSENSEKILETMIAWGRYAGLMDYDTNTEMLMRPESEEDEKEQEQERKKRG